MKREQENKIQQKKNAGKKRVSWEKRIKSVETWQRCQMRPPFRLTCRIALAHAPYPNVCEQSRLCCHPFLPISKSNRIDQSSSLMNVLHTTGIDCIFMQCSAAVSDEIDIYADDTIIYIYIFWRGKQKKKTKNERFMYKMCGCARVSYIDCAHPSCL